MHSLPTPKHIFLDFFKIFYIPPLQIELKTSFFGRWLYTDYYLIRIPSFQLFYYFIQILKLPIHVFLRLKNCLHIC